MQENNFLIHLIAPKNRNKWHPIWEHCFKFWENSSYNIKLWNDEEDIDSLLQEDDYDFFSKLNSLDKIFKLDYVRYLILKKFGGAYFDMDVEINLDFLHLLDPKKIYIVQSHSLDEIVQNSIMIGLDPTSQSSFFWESVKNYSKSKIISSFKNCKDLFYKLPHGTNVRETVGPIMLSEAYKAYENENFQLLSHLHFNNTFHDIKICHHHQTGIWDTI